MTETLFGNLEQIAIERLQEFEKVALSKHPDGYYLAYSGGKDSDVILDLAKRSGVKFTAHHHLTTCDPPELVYHVRTHPEVDIIKPKLTLWKLIRKRGMLPRRNARYCCDYLKENGEKNKDRMIITGVRWGESGRRSKRRMVETCFKKKTRQYLHPIIDWEYEDVWAYINTRNVSYCSIYDEGFNRIGCVLCPMSGAEQAIKEAKRWPKLANAWQRAFYDAFDKKKMPKNTKEEVWEWWINRGSDNLNVKSDDNQMMFFDD